MQKFLFNLHQEILKWFSGREQNFSLNDTNARLEEFQEFEADKRRGYFRNSGANRLRAAVIDENSLGVKLRQWVLCSI